MNADDGVAVARKAAQSRHRIRLGSGADPLARAHQHAWAMRREHSLISDDAPPYVQVRTKLERAGTPIGPLDTRIAAHAVARKLTLVTNNEREFKRVTGLHVEDWAS